MRVTKASLLFLILSTLLLSGLSHSQEKPTTSKPVPELKAVRINPEIPKIDGYLDDEIWQSSKIFFAGDFTQLEPDEGIVATESTLVSIVYNDDAIYIAFWNYDSEPDKIKAQLVRRDRWAESDNVVVRLDPYHDHQTGYRFEVSAAGVQGDMKLFDDTNGDSNWDGVWASAVKIHSWGWAAEIKIPYHCLRFGKKDVHTWGLNLSRYISRKGELNYWAFSPSSEGGSVSRYGHLSGLAGITPATHMEILPYLVSNFESTPKSSTIPGDDGQDFFNNTGFDLKYGLTSNLTLDATINPDFGQVELDSPILNLSAFETFFGEKRPFFLEGADLFSTRFMLFYSRRIGRPPNHGFDDSTFFEFTDYPKATSIIGAGKLTGKLASGTSIGIISAVTAEEKAEYLTTKMETRKGIVEPTANYSVFRIKQDVLGNSSIGALLTMATQDTENPATTGGIDWRLLTNSSNYGFEGQVVFSKVEGHKTGLGYTAEFSKNAGKHIRGSFGGTVKDPHLQLNRLGYTSRNDDQRIFSWIQYRTSDDWWIIRNSYNNFNYYANWNYSGTNTGKGANYNTYIEFINYWSLGGGVQIDMTEYNDYETRGNGLWKVPGQPTYAWWASFNTDQRKSVSLNLNPGSGVDRDGTWWANYIGIDYRPSETIELSVGANYHRTFGARRWVYDDANPLVFARLDKDQLTPRLTASIMFHRNLSFQASARGIIAALDYREAEEYLGEDVYKDIEIADEEAKYDYNYTALNSTLLLRWEYRPGSTLYVVWTRSRGEIDETTNDLGLSRDFSRFFSDGADNVFLIKASYWWNI